MDEGTVKVTRGESIEGLGELIADRNFGGPAVGGSDPYECSHQGDGQDEGQGARTASEQVSDLLSENKPR
jgi:hypothetical protein